jgi:hypothetical protein
MTSGDMPRKLFRLITSHRTILALGRRLFCPEKSNFNGRVPKKSVPRARLCDVFVAAAIGQAGGLRYRKIAVIPTMQNVMEQLFLVPPASEDLPAWHLRVWKLCIGLQHWQPSKVRMLVWVIVLQAPWPEAVFAIAR